MFLAPGDNKPEREETVRDDYPLQPVPPEVALAPDREVVILRSPGGQSKRPGGSKGKP